MNRTDMIKIFLLALIGGWIGALYLVLTRHRYALYIPANSMQCSNRFSSSNLFFPNERRSILNQYPDIENQKSYPKEVKNKLLDVLKQKIQVGSNIFVTNSKKQQLIEWINLTLDTSSFAQYVITHALQDADFSLAANKAPDSINIAGYTIDKDTIYLDKQHMDKVLARRVIAEEFIHRFYARKYFANNPKLAIQNANFETPAAEDAFIKKLQPDPIKRSPFPFNNEAEFKRVDEYVKKGEARIEALIAIAELPLANLSAEQQKLKQAAEYYQPQLRTTLKYRPVKIGERIFSNDAAYPIYATFINKKFVSGYFAANLAEPRNRIIALMNDYRWEKLYFSYLYKEGVTQVLMEKHAKYCSQDQEFIKVYFPELYAYTLKQLKAFTEKCYPFNDTVEDTKSMRYAC
ncbi:MAG: hypothetical protein K0S11_1603 [Gammaproteobacteria bacterium]|jgi:hypothetical protein|nr:hypothetical protein [Gammaproteobacteria bacterium]